MEFLFDSLFAGHITQYVEGGHLEVKHMKEHYVDIAKVLSDLHSIQLSEEEKVEFDGECTMDVYQLYSNSEFSICVGPNGRMAKESKEGLV